MAVNTLGYDAPPFELGETYKGTDADSNLINGELVGRVYNFKASDLTAGSAMSAKKVRSSRGITAICMRNTSGITLYGKRLCVYSTTAGVDAIEKVTGYSTTLGTVVAGFIDEYLSSTGVAANDLFWLIISGPILALTPTAGADFNGDIAVGAPLIAATAASSQTTSAGRVSNVTLPGQTGATSSLNQALYVVGKALSARTTGNTNSDILVNAGVNFF